MDCRNLSGSRTGLQFFEGQCILAGQHCFSVPIGEILTSYTSFMIFYLRKRSFMEVCLIYLEGWYVWGKLCLLRDPLQELWNCMYCLCFEERAIESW